VCGGAVNQAQVSRAGKIDTAEIPFTKMASSLYLWTLQGAVRHCKLVGTKQAWDMFHLLEQAYFDKTAAQEDTPEDFQPEFSAAPLSDEFTRREKYNELKYLIELPEMNEGREKLILKTAELLLGEKL